jgi:hypothetical protein
VQLPTLEDAYLALVGDAATRDGVGDGDAA